MRRRHGIPQPFAGWGGSRGATIAGPGAVAAEGSRGAVVAGPGAGRAARARAGELAAWTAALASVVVVRPEPRFVGIVLAYLGPAFLLVGLVLGRDRGHWLRAVRTFLALVLVWAGFVAWKHRIGTVYPFVWDEPLARLDEALHLGRHPWVWLWPLIREPALLGVVDHLYGRVWHVLVQVTLAVAVWRGQQRFIAAWVANWVLLGVVAATALASAGPIFLDRTGSPAAGEYAALLSWIRAHAETASTASDALWSGYLSGAPTFGISSMPSLHVAMAVLFWLGFRRHGRVLGAALAAYAAVVLVGSVALAWHYAVDGYLAAAVAALLWWACGRFTHDPPLSTELSMRDARRHWSDYAGAAWYAAFAVFMVLRGGGIAWLMIPVLAKELLISLAFLSRDRLRDRHEETWPRLLAYVVTFYYPVLILLADEAGLGWFRATETVEVRLAGWLFWLAGTLLAIVAIAALRHAISIEPQARTLVTDGPYRFARHPIYAAYILLFGGTTLMSLTPVSAALFLAWIALMWRRAQYEEVVLERAFPEAYASYRERVGPFGPKSLRQRRPGVAGP